MKMFLMFAGFMLAFACMEICVVKADTQPSHQFEYVMPSMTVESNDLVLDQVVVYDETYTYGIFSFETESKPVPSGISRGPPSESYRFRSKYTL